MKKIKYIFIIIFIFLTSNISYIFATPSISLSNGVIANNGKIVIEGNNFGTNNAVGSSDLQWLGENIENGPKEGVFSATGWTSSNSTESDTAAVPRYVADQAHSGNKSIAIDYAKDMPNYSPLNRYSGYFLYKRPNMGKVYITYWTRGYWDNVANGQWKQVRIQRDQSPVNSSSGPGFYLSKSSASGNLIENYPTAIPGQMASSFRTSTGCTDSVPPGYSIHYMNNNTLAGNSAGGTWDKWYRYEIYTEEGTPGNTDGTLIYRIHEPGVSIRTGANYNRCVEMVGAGVTEHFNYLVLGHYAGDKFSTVTGWWDDVFVQIGSQARVEIGDASTWDACTHREIQVPTSWSDTKIDVTLNLGSFDDKSQKELFLYVVDAEGNVNQDGMKLDLRPRPSIELIIPQ